MAISTNPAPRMMVVAEDEDIYDDGGGYYDSGGYHPGGGSGDAGGGGGGGNDGGYVGDTGSGNFGLDTDHSTGDPAADAQIDAEIDTALSDSALDTTLEGTAAEPLNQNKFELTPYGAKIYLNSDQANSFANNLIWQAGMSALIPESILTKIYAGGAGA